MISAAPTIVALETNSAWIVILAVSLVTLPVALVLRRLIDRPGALASSLLLGLPLGLPLLAAAFFQESVLPEVSVLRPFAPRMFERPDWNLLHFLFVPDGRGKALVPYVFSGAPGRWVFLLGAAFSSFMLLRRLAGTIALHRLVGRCLEAGAQFHPALLLRVRELSKASGLRAVPQLLLLPEGAPGAFVMGGRRSRILISSELVARLSPDELDAILAHEIAHVMARDLPVTVIAGVLRDLTAWNPLAHVALRRLVAEREFEADRCAARITGKPLALASSLLKMCELMGTRSRFDARGAAAFLRRRGPLRRRVANLLALADGQVSSSSAGRLPYVAAACLAAALGLQAGAHVAQQADFAIVWDAPNTRSIPLWRHDRSIMELKKGADRTPTRATGGRAALKPKGKPVAYAPFEQAYALRKKDLPVWVKSVASWARSQGLPAKFFVSEVRQGWEAIPVFTRSTIGPFGLYRMDLFGPRPLPGPRPETMGRKNTR